MDKLIARIELLEYHQKLLLNMISYEGFEFDRLIIQKNMNEREVNEFYKLCEEMSKEAEEQKAEKFVFYAPLFNEFLSRLNPKLDAAETIHACIKQNIYRELMEILKKNL